MLAALPIMKNLPRTVLEGIGSGIALGAVMGLLLLWVGSNLFPDVEVIYLLFGVAFLVTLIIWVANKIAFTKKKDFKPGSK